MMLFVAIIAQFAVGGLTLVGLRRRPAVAAGLGLVVLASAAATVIAEGVAVSSAPRTTVDWIPALGFNLTLELDGFAVLMSLILPAVQQAREAGRRTQCMNNQKNLALGMIAYATARRGKLPGSGYYGVNVTSAPTLWPQRSWVVELLPNLDQGPLADRWNRNVRWDDNSAPKADLTNRAIGLQVGKVQV